MKKALQRRLSALKIVLFAAGAMIGLAVLALLAARCAGAKAGTTPDWLAAFATLGAFGAALVAGWYAHRALTVEQDRDRRRDQDDRDRERRELRAQAEKIAAWATTPSASKTNGVVDRPQFDVVVRNASDLPITDVRLHLQARVGEREALTRQGAFQELGDVTYELVPPSADPLSELAPIAKRDQVRDLMNTSQGLNVSVLVKMTFTDAGGRVWVREQDGTLHSGEEPVY